MSLPINPLAKLISAAQTQIASVTNSFSSSLPTDTSLLSKSGLDKTVGRLGGDVGSGLNGITSGVQQAQSALGAVRGLGDLSADIVGSINKLTGGSLGGGLQKAAAGISGAAGAVYNLASLFRGANIPKGAELFTKEAPAIQLSPAPEDDWRVKIWANWELFGFNSLFEKLEETGGVVWPYNPSITVSTKADYNSITPTHSNYATHSYKGSMVDDITISGEFSCETEADAAYWIAATTFFKTATKMFYGESEFAGSPPIVCHLYGYGASIFDRVPIIIKSFSVDLKDDINYIFCNSYGTNTWVPILSTVTVTVSPIYNRAGQRKFSLQDYARGEMISSESGVRYL